ncbi:DUF1992 domain-containing protein [Nocardioides sp. BP30]|uniref:DnaJ family domain-containing protein n=1 Tax=Nocardioides sp. BP30 TaxID=3036374 RepID=UPI00246898A4|nr:DUF1992 domain-containing protein [Nocardioides sp. BP30]WGL52294.1 DUF1992 domain-containing protein [Nocardioides sp. BP30]
MAEEEFEEVRIEPLRDAASKAEAARRQREIHTWVDQQIQQAIARGEFDDLPGAGRPVEGLGEEHDPDWWLKKLVERERLVVLPPSIQLRKDDAELDDLLDRQVHEQAARELVEEFNARVLQARYQIPSGPPLITQPRDVEETISAWRARRTARAAASPPAPEPSPRRRWFRRR